jgi:hypothetical protein
VEQQPDVLLAAVLLEFSGAQGLVAQLGVASVQSFGSRCAPLLRALGPSDEREAEAERRAIEQPRLRTVGGWMEMPGFGQHIRGHE